MHELSLYVQSNCSRKGILYLEGKWMEGFFFMLWKYLNVVFILEAPTNVFLFNVTSKLRNFGQQSTDLVFQPNQSLLMLAIHHKQLWWVTSRWLKERTTKTIADLSPHSWLNIFVYLARSSRLLAFWLPLPLFHTSSWSSSRTSDELIGQDWWNWQHCQLAHIHTMHFLCRDWLAGGLENKMHSPLLHDYLP